MKPNDRIVKPLSPNYDHSNDPTNDPIFMAKEIWKTSCKIDDLRSSLKDLSKAKAEAKRDHSKKMQLTILTLKAQGMQATIMRDIAKGECCEEEMKEDLAESMFKIALVELDAIKTQMNGLMSINKNLSEI